MTYTEIKERNRKKYFYRVRSIREGKKVSKKREYLGVDLTKKQLSIEEKEADKILDFPTNRKKENLKELSRLKPKIRRILIKNSIKKAGIFGSYARGEQKKNSDIDVLIDVRGRRFSLVDLVRLEAELKKKLGIKVDLLTYNGVNPLIKERILKDEVRII